jgi:hypothetical protein
MGLEVRGATMNPSRRTASQANDDLNIGHRVYVAIHSTVKAIETGTGPDSHSPKIINAHLIIVY